MQKALKILLLEDDPEDAEILQRILLKSKPGSTFNLAVTKSDYKQALEKFQPDIILSDHSLPQFNSADALLLARESFPEIPFIMVTGAVSEEFAVEILKLGADDYILKDRLNRLPASIDTALGKRRTENEKQEADKRLIQSEQKYRTLVEQAFDGIIIYSTEGIILDCNHSACTSLGYQQNELIKLSIAELFFKEDIVKRPLYFESLKAGKITLDYRRLKKKDGTAIEMEIGTKMMPDGNLMAIGRDITERKESEKKIIQSESNLRTIFENTSEGFLLLDKAGIIKSFNQNARDYAFFLKENKMKVGDRLIDFIEPSRKESYLGMIAKVLNGETIHYDRPHDLENGKTRWIDFSITPVVENGNVNGVCLTGRDITEKKAVEQQTDFDHNNLHALINNTNDLMWSVDRNFKLITFNEAFEKTIRNLAGEDISNLSEILATGFGAAQTERLHKYYERAFSGESFIEIEHLTTPFEYWAEISFYPIRKYNEVIGTACFSHNITGRKKAEREIADYKNALDQSAIVSITNEKGIFTYVNENFCKISKYRAVELLGDDHHKINSGFHDKAFMRNLWTTIGKGQIWRNEVKNKAKDGTFYWIDSTIVPFLDNKGKPVQYVAIEKDLTEKKLMEQEIQEQKTQEQKKIIRAMLKGQERERNHIGQELHDNVNQILASTKLMLAMAGNSNVQLKELVKYPMELIDNSIAEIRLLSSRIVTPEKNIQLKDLVMTLLDKLHSSTNIKAILHYGVDNEIMDDDLKLNIYRIIQEQVNNIVKHSAAENVSVSVESVNNVISIFVTDDGKGFNLKDKRKGIGISNMTNRTESFNGKISVISSPGNGCKIQVSLPY